MKKISVAIFTPVIIGVAASLVAYFPSYFHLPPEWAKFVTAIPTVGAMATGGIIFLATLSRKDEQNVAIITRG